MNTNQKNSILRKFPEAIEIEIFIEDSTNGNIVIIKEPNKTKLYNTKYNTILEKYNLSAGFNKLIGQFRKNKKTIESILVLEDILENFIFWDYKSSNSFVGKHIISYEIIESFVFFKNNLNETAIWNFKTGNECQIKVCIFGDFFADRRWEKITTWEIRENIILIKREEDFIVWNSQNNKLIISKANILSWTINGDFIFLKDKKKTNIFNHETGITTGWGKLV